MIWDRASKAIYVECSTILVWVFMIHCSFLIDAAIASYKVLKGMNVEADEHMTKGLKTANKFRKRRVQYRMSKPQLKCRKIIGHLCKRKQDNNLDKEGPTL